MCGVSPIGSPVRRLAVFSTAVASDKPGDAEPANIAATAGFGAVAVLADVVASFAWITPGSPDGIPWKLSRPVVGLRAE